MWGLYKFLIKVLQWWSMNIDQYIWLKTILHNHIRENWPTLEFFQLIYGYRWYSQISKSAWIWNVQVVYIYFPLVDLMWVPGTGAIRESKFFHFHAVIGKKKVSTPTLGFGAPSGKYWICHCFQIYFLIDGRCKIRNKFVKLLQTSDPSDVPVEWSRKQPSKTLLCFTWTILHFFNMLVLHLLSVAPVLMKRDCLHVPSLFNSSNSPQSSRLVSRWIN